MTTERIAGLIDRLPEGVTEIYTHPATDGDYPGAAPGYRYAEELAALVAPRVKAAVDAAGCRWAATPTLSSTSERARYQRREGQRTSARVRLR